MAQEKDEGKRQAILAAAENSFGISLPPLAT
jgi:hypothetical protein